MRQRPAWTRRWDVRSRQSRTASDDVKLIAKGIALSEAATKERESEIQGRENLLFLGPYRIAEDNTTIMVIFVRRTTAQGTEQRAAP